MLLSAADKTGRLSLLRAAPGHREDDRNYPWCWNRQLLCSTLGWFCEPRHSVATVTLFGFNSMCKCWRSYRASLSTSEVNMGSEAFHGDTLTLWKELWPSHTSSWVILSHKYNILLVWINTCCISLYVYCALRGSLQFCPALQCLLCMSSSYKLRGNKHETWGRFCDKWN